jgi:hypothetical protein
MSAGNPVGSQARDRLNYPCARLVGVSLPGTAVQKEEKVTAGGFSPKRLTRVRDVLSRCVDAGYFPGAVAVVGRHGEVHIEATGNLAFEGAGSRTPMAGGSGP